MAIKDHGRQYDIVVFGATGYTGKSAAEHITTNLPTNLKWAVAGRSEAKLQDVINEIQKLNPDRTPPAIEVLDVKDEQKLSDLAKKSFSIIAAVGPYCYYGEPVIKACAESGTHYFDVTGEAVWVLRMIRKYHETAKKSGAIIIPQMGIESAPADLCAWALAKCLRTKLNAKTKDVLFSLHKIHGSLSGGTLATILANMEVYSLQDFRESASPFVFSPIPHPAEPKRLQTSLVEKILGVREVSDLGTLTTSPTSSTDQTQVERSWGLLSQMESRKEEFYGPNFHWAEYMKARNWLQGAAFHWAILFVIGMVSLVPFVRTLAKKIVAAPGTGSSKEEAAKQEIEYRGVANPDTETPSGKQAVCRAWYNGGLYYLTAVFVVQGALTLLEDDVNLEGGLLTPCCLGQGFLDRMSGVGFKLETKIQDK